MRHKGIPSVMKFSQFKMLLRQTVLAAMIFLLFVLSGVSATTTVAPSPSLTVSNSSPSTPQPNSTVTNNVTNTVTSTVTNTVGGGGQGGVSVTQVVNQTASVPVKYVEWSDWKTEKPNDCKEKCCETGNPVIRQIRTCNITRQRCNLTECQNYGQMERDISCYTVCSECMPNAGYIMTAPGLIIITTALLLSALRHEALKRRQTSTDGDLLDKNDANNALAEHVM